MSLTLNIKYHVEVVFGKELKIFSECTYTYNGTLLRIQTSEGTTEEFIGNFSARILSMEDYQRTTH